MANKDLLEIIGEAFEEVEEWLAFETDLEENNPWDE